MKTLRLNHILLGVYILCSSVGFGQEDSLRVYVTPEKSTADLNLLTAPEGFVISEMFNGYIHYQSSTSIVMTMIDNVSYLDMEKGMTEDYFTSNDMVFVKSEKVKTDHDYGGLIYKATFTLEGQPFVRYFAYIGDLNQTLWLSITYPVKVEELIEGVILKCIKSVNLKPVKDEE
ncbi:MAG: hypothetical protein HRT57_13085 [Crocinitomicaceae bacterium]|nr:hypothetical protein [Crocinitomicaceae bacterium]